MACSNRTMRCVALAALFRASRRAIVSSGAKQRVREFLGKFRFICEALTADWKPGIQPGFRKLMKEDGLCGRFLGKSSSASCSSAVASAARSSLRIELTRISQTVCSGFCLLAVVLPAADLAFDLDVGALLERGGKLAELAENDAAVPLGVRDVFAVLLVGGLGCEREGGELRLLLVRTSASLPRKPMRMTLFWYMVVFSVFEFPYLARVTPGEASEWARLPSAKEPAFGAVPSQTET